MRRADGQSTVEVIGLLPLLLAVGLGVFAFLSAGAAREAASGAAEAGAVALLQGRDARAAARAALPGWPRRRTRITVAGRRVTGRGHPERPLRSPPPGHRERGRRRLTLNFTLTLAHWRSSMSGWLDFGSGGPR